MGGITAQLVASPRFNGRTRRARSSKTPRSTCEKCTRHNPPSTGSKPTRSPTSDAEKFDKIRLGAVSGFRSAETQRGLYLKKIESAGMDQNVVARPAHSEHQLGTTLDVTGLDPATLLETPFENTPEGRWVRDNASKYGFRLSYTRQNARRPGYIPEPWHLRYVGKSRVGKANDE